jgi:hypothetical protein
MASPCINTIEANAFGCQAISLDGLPKMQLKKSLA